MTLTVFKSTLACKSRVAVECRRSQKRILLGILAHQPAASGRATAHYSTKPVADAGMGSVGLFPLLPVSWPREADLDRLPEGSMADDELPLL
jgi:hypothetical protein